MSLRQPRTEAHLSQLAVLENFAEHGLYVKFSNEEAEELEREALALALEESTQEVGSDRCAFTAESLHQHLSQILSKPLGRQVVLATGSSMHLDRAASRESASAPVVPLACR